MTEKPPCSGGFFLPCCVCGRLLKYLHCQTNNKYFKLMRYYIVLSVIYVLLFLAYYTKILAFVAAIVPWFAIRYNDKMLSSMPSLFVEHFRYIARTGTLSLIGVGIGVLIYAFVSRLFDSGDSVKSGLNSFLVSTAGLYMLMVFFFLYGRTLTGAVSLMLKTKPLAPFAFVQYWAKRLFKPKPSDQVEILLKSRLANVQEK